MNFKQKIEAQYEVWTEVEPGGSYAKLVFEASEHEPYKEIYRVQNDKGVGPYTSSDLKWKKTWHDSSTGHPPPGSDPGFSAEEKALIRDKSAHYRFGFTDLNQLHKWFSDEELEELEKRGYKIVKEKALKIWQGDKQAFYLPIDKKRWSPMRGEFLDKEGWNKTYPWDEWKDD